MILAPPGNGIPHPALCTPHLLGLPVQSGFIGIGGPDGADRIFVAEPIRDCRAWIIGEVPVYVRRARGAAAGHLKIAVGVCLAHPIPSVFQPVSAILSVLVSKPGDFIITPDPDASRLRLP